MKPSQEDDGHDDDDEDDDVVVVVVVAPVLPLLFVSFFFVFLGLPLKNRNLTTCRPVPVDFAHLTGRVQLNNSTETERVVVVLFSLFVVVVVVVVIIRCCSLPPLPMVVPTRFIRPPLPSFPDGNLFFFFKKKQQKKKKPETQPKPIRCELPAW